MDNKIVALAKQLIHQITNTRIGIKTTRILQSIKEFIAKNKDDFYNLNHEQFIWVEEKELGTEKLIKHKNKSYYVKVPPKINKKVTLRLRGLGKTKGNKTGDLFLRLYLNKGQDVRKNLWLSESAAKIGVKKKIALANRKIIVTIPPNSYHGLAIQLKGQGRMPGDDWLRPTKTSNRGNLLVKLFVYPDDITPIYGSFDSLNTDNMVLEGWVYRKIDEIIDKIGKSAFQGDPIQTNIITDTYNEYGWHGIFTILVNHLNLKQYHVKLNKSDSIPMPGSCERITWTKGNKYVNHYTILINEKFISNPFLVAAILAHELCHLIYSEKIEKRADPRVTVIKSDKAKLEEERTIDLLVFMYKLGEFQIRVSRDQNLTLGYFNQKLFDRIQVIVSKRRGIF